MTVAVIRQPVTPAKMLKEGTCVPGYHIPQEELWLNDLKVETQAGHLIFLRKLNPLAELLHATPIFLWLFMVKSGHIFPM